MIKISLDGVGRLMPNRLTHLLMKHIQLFTPMSQFVPLFYGHQAIPLTKDDILNVGMIMMQCRLTGQWPSYHPGIHSKPTTSFKFMQKKGKVPTYTKPMPHPGPKDNIVLHPIPYDRSRYFIKDTTKKTIVLKPDAEFDQNNTMLFYFKDMYENSRLASTSEYNKEDTSNHMCMVQILRPTEIYRFND